MINKQTGQEINGWIRWSWVEGLFYRALLEIYSHSVYTADFYESLGSTILLIQDLYINNNTLFFCVASNTKEKHFKRKVTVTLL